MKSIKRKPEDNDVGMKFNVNLLNEVENIILKLYQKQYFFERLSALSKTVAYIVLIQYQMTKDYCVWEVD